MSRSHLVLVPGLLCDQAVWEHQAEALRHLTHIEIADHGQLDSLGEMAKRILETTPTRFAIAGHSMGAMIANGVVATYPERIGRLAFLSGTGRRTPDKRTQALARAAAILDRSVDQEAQLKRWYGDDHPVLTDVTRAWLATVNWKGYATAYLAYATGDEVYCDVWPKVTCSVLFLAGDRDAGTPVELIHELGTITPKGKSVIVDGHAHMVPLTAANAVTGHLLDWLAAE